MHLFHVANMTYEHGYIESKSGFYVQYLQQVPLLVYVPFYIASLSPYGFHRTSSFAAVTFKEPVLFMPSTFLSSRRLPAYQLWPSEFFFSL